MMENYHEGQAKKEEEGGELEKDGGFSFRRMEDVSSCGVVLDQNGARYLAGWNTEIESNLFPGQKNRSLIVRLRETNYLLSMFFHDVVEGIG